MKSYTLNQAGKNSIVTIIQEQCKQEVVDNLQNGKFSWFQDAEANVTESGGYFEIPARMTKSGNPYAVDCEIEWYDAEYIDE